METAEKVCLFDPPSSFPYPSKPHLLTFCFAGGKAKPLKAPKKEKKELDEEEIAFREKQKTGMLALGDLESSARYFP